MAKKDDIIAKVSAMLPANAVCRDDAYRSGVVFSATAEQGKVREVLGCFRDAGFYLESVTALDFQDIHLEVMDMDGLRVDKILARRAENPGAQVDSV